MSHQRIETFVETDKGWCICDLWLDEAVEVLEGVIKARKEEVEFTLTLDTGVVKITPRHLYVTCSDLQKILQFQRDAEQQTC
ncbi:hypothetical protein IH981_01150 [Patescibacteria group bacterium]|nr:hypothetical protein [Patescibacteria group bacterium]